MATISVTRPGLRIRITLAGRLKAKDLKRLERACGHALQHEFVPLELDVAQVTFIDESARTYLDRLCARGATVLGAPAIRESPAGD